MLADYDATGIAEVMGLMTGHNAAPVPQAFREDAPRSSWGERRAVSLSPKSLPGFAMTPVGLEEAVAHGLPRQVLRHLAERIAGDDAAKVSALEWSIVPKTTLERRTDRLSPAESERTERVARLFVHAWRALGSEEEARGFMLSPHAELDGRSPVEAARSDLAARRVERLLNAVEYGLAI